MSIEIKPVYQAQAQIRAGAFGANLGFSDIQVVGPGFIVLSLDPKDGNFPTQAGVILPFCTIVGDEVYFISAFSSGNEIAIIIENADGPADADFDIFVLRLPREN